MTIVALGSAKASPGVTTTSVMLAAAWPGDGRVLIVEADPDGGALATRYGMSREPGLLSAAAATRRGSQPDDGLDDLWHHTQELPGGTSVLAGPPSADQAHAALSAGTHLAGALDRLDAAAVLVDCGRLRPGSPALPLAFTAGLTILVARPRLDEAHHLVSVARSLRDACPKVGLVTVGRRPYPPEEVAAAIAVPLVGVIADDPPSAESVRAGRGSPRALRRSALARSALEVAEAIRRAAVEPVPVGASR